MTIEEKEQSSHQEIAIILTDYSLNLVAKHGNFYDQTKALLSNTPQVQSSNYDIKVYDAQVGEFPEISQLGDKIKAIWITGSAHDAFADDEWIIKLTEYLATIIKLQACPVVGICFGHQIIGRAIGGSVGRNDKGWELGIDKVQINSSDAEIKELFKDISESKGDDNTFDILEVHQDIVQSIPAGSDFKIIGSTEKCAIQGIYKKDSVLTFQGHPEFNKPVLRDISVNIREQGHISEEVLHKSLTDLKTLEHDGAGLMELVIAKFMGL
ncbi:hypothetical protein WICPIJ_008304 [Wickerhamomyces pijperi]|uniref:Glutamine amidotransferase domain-containing protein n=1 Tax=Wickerhamomyces pijperi TaxID=599730 RepID=A0A9P8Q019_WICPI|nr:hypothetical protein WICPIJ_008304 [Wickerhamomyces pijperi]